MWELKGQQCGPENNCDLSNKAALTENLLGKGGVVASFSGSKPVVSLTETIIDGAVKPDTGITRKAAEV